MNEINHTNFEAAVLREVERVLESYASELMQSGLRAELVGLQKRNSGTTELTIYIWRDADLIDALEFFVTESGKPAAAEDEITFWLHEQLRGVLQEER